MMHPAASHARADTWRSRLLVVAAPVLLIAPASLMVDPARGAEIRQSQAISLETDNAQLIQLPEQAKTVFVANPDIADIQLANPTSVLVYGKRLGSTTVFAISETGATTSYLIRVSRPTAEISAALQREVPSAHVTVTATPGRISVSGHVGSPRDAEKLKALATQFLGEKRDLNFGVVVDASIQVTLRVRVAEVSRSVDRAFGLNWDAAFNNGVIAVALLTDRFAGTAAVPPTGRVTGAALIDALSKEGLATILAEPNLTATSGETANFLAGGEFPIPVPQGNQTVTIDYKRFGVSVEFTPTVFDGNRIAIKVRPEVSQLTSVGGLKLNGVEIPALTVRRAETTVELGSGESFAIAGLFQNNGTNSLNALPGLGDIPILGALFRSTRFQRNESELVIIVTPFIVRPVARAADLHMPTEGLQYTSDIERILTGRASRTSQAAAPTTATQPPPRLRGSAGFMLE